MRGMGIDSEAVTHGRRQQGLLKAVAVAEGGGERS